MPESVSNDERDLSRATAGQAFAMSAGVPVERPRITLTLTPELRLSSGAWPDAVSVVAGDVALGIVSYTGGAGPTNRAPSEHALPARAITNLLSVDFVHDIPVDAQAIVATAEPNVRRGHDVLRTGEVVTESGLVVARTSSWWHVIEGGHDPRRVAADRAADNEQSTPPGDSIVELPQSVAAGAAFADFDTARSPIAAHLGLLLARADDRQADLWLLEPQRFRNSGGTLFGGACGVLAMFAAQAAVAAMSPDTLQIPMNLSLHFLRPAGGGTMPVLATGTVMRRGRNVAHADATVFTADHRAGVAATYTAGLVSRS